MPPEAAHETQEAELETILEAIPVLDDAGENADGDAAPRADARTLVARARREMEAAFAAEFDRIQTAVAQTLDELERRVALADTELARLAAERERLIEENAIHERRLRAIRDVAGLNDRP